MLFPGNQIFPEKSGKFPVPSIWEHPHPGPVSVPPFGTGHFLSRLSTEKETGIPEFEIFGKFGKNFLLGTEICYINQDQTKPVKNTSCLVLKYELNVILLSNKACL